MSLLDSACRVRRAIFADSERIREDVGETERRLGSTMRLSDLIPSVWVPKTRIHRSASWLADG
jgi:hypothetical protein